MAEPQFADGLDLTDPDVLVDRIPHEEFAELRRTCPVWWNAQAHGSAGFDDDGYWAVTRHADVMAVSRDSETYSTWQNTAIVRFREGMPRENIEMQRLVMLNIDPPQHTKVRAIVSRGFTPRAINALRNALSARAERIARDALEKGSGNFVTDVACELPLQAIAELLGIPQEDRLRIFDWSNQMVGYDDPEYGADPMMAAGELLAYAMKMAEERQQEPQNDIVTQLVNAEIDGGHLTADEFGFFVLLLAVAGNETTRNAISGGMLAFLQNPEQWELFKAERPRSAVEEIIRWATPVIHFRRTAMRDVEVAGQTIREGEKVVLWYNSANRDERAFADPYRFDVTRTPNDHVGFGGGGAHFCLGANLARREIKAMFDELFRTLPDIHVVGEPDMLFSAFIHGIKRMRVEWTPR